MFCPEQKAVELSLIQGTEAFVNPKIYQHDQHKIAPEKIDQHAFYVIEKLRRAGHTAYLVGGSVRDLLLNIEPKDFDVSTSAKPEEIRSLFHNAILIGRRFRLAHIRFGRKVIEVATFRSGEIASSQLIVRDNEWGTEEEDVLRRDFTINGLCYEPKSESIIDYVGGYEDLERKVLRTIGQPEARFQQDPVRMIRLIKFCAKLNFEIDKPTFEALLACRGSIIKSSAVRVLEELLRMLESGFAKPFFYLLQQYGVLAALMPELSHFLENQSDEITFRLLAEIDATKNQKNVAAEDRSFFLAVLIFPLVDQYLQQKGKMEGKTFHLGEVVTHVLYVIDCVFSSFFKLSKKMRSTMAFLITSQYRFTPLSGKAALHPRLPHDPLVPLALRLLQLRAAVQPELLSAYTTWTERSFRVHAADQAEQQTEEGEPRKRRRRRRRR